MSKRIGFIGLGNMGRGMCRNLIRAGHTLTVFDTSEAAAEAFRGQAEIAGSVAQVGQNYGTNVARALYFGFMTLEEGDNFCPGRLVSVKEAAGILDRVADFAGI